MSTAVDISALGVKPLTITPGDAFCYLQVNYRHFYSNLCLICDHKLSNKIEFFSEYTHISFLIVIFYTANIYYYCASGDWRQKCQGTSPLVQIIAESSYEKRQ